MKISIVRIGSHGECFSLTTTQTIWKDKRHQEVSQNIKINEKSLNALTIEQIYAGGLTFEGEINNG